MKVKELIGILQGLDQERNLVTVFVDDGEVVINSVEGIHEDTDGLYHIY